jgi:pimeloyl-ACP methyl ester carboxylesterase
MTRASPGKIRPQFRTIDGLSIRFAESEPHDRHALLLSPWPESVFAYQPSWEQLSEAAHLVAVDLPGFGHSEKRDGLLNPRAMGEFIVRTADAFNLEKPHVVGPDIGTSAALFAAGFAPSRFSSLVIGSGGAAVPLQLGGVLAEWVNAPDLAPYRTIDPRQIVGAAIASLERYTLSPEAQDDYLTAYLGDRFVESMRYVRAYPEQLPVLRDLLSQITTPTLVFAGAHDTFVPPANAEFLVARLPFGKLAIIDAGHFVWEDAAADFAKTVTDWWNRGYAEGKARHT